MTRIRFEDLPSTNTPRNAENLNKLNNVVISSTEPTTGEEIWLEKGKNLFNINDLILGYVPSVSNGELVENASRATTEMIEINNSVAYTWKSSDSITYIFYYGENKSFLGYNQLAANSSYILSSNTNWAQTKYIRIRIEEPSNITNAQLEYGSTATTYEEFKPHKIYENKDGNYDLFTETVHVGNSEGASSVNFIKGKNLFDKSTEKVGYWISNQQDTVNTAWNLSDYIEVSSNTAYILSSTYISGQSSEAQTEIAEYDKNKTYIANHFLSSLTNSITTSGTTHYVKIAYRNDKQTNIQLEKGSTATSYEPYVDRAIVVDGEEIYKKGFEEYSISDYGATGSNIYPTTDGSYIKKIGNLIILSVNMAFNTLTANSLTTVLNLPLQFSPKKLVIGTGNVHSNGSNIVAAQIVVNTNGSVQVRSSQSGSKQILFQIIYTLN